jgi:hypothetical protein
MWVIQNKIDLRLPNAALGAAFAFINDGINLA